MSTRLESESTESKSTPPGFNGSVQAFISKKQAENPSMNIQSIASLPTGDQNRLFDTGRTNYFSSHKELDTQLIAILDKTNILATEIESSRNEETAKSEASFKNKDDDEAQLTSAFNAIIIEACNQEPELEAYFSDTEKNEEQPEAKAAAERVKHALVFKIITDFQKAVNDKAREEGREDDLSKNMQVIKAMQQFNGTLTYPTVEKAREMQPLVELCTAYRAEHQARYDAAKKRTGLAGLAASVRGTARRLGKKSDEALNYNSVSKIQIILHELSLCKDITELAAVQKKFADILSPIAETAGPKLQVILQKTKELMTETTMRFGATLPESSSSSDSEPIPPKKAGPARPLLREDTFTSLPSLPARPAAATLGSVQTLIQFPEKANLSQGNIRILEGLIVNLNKAGNPQKQLQALEAVQGEFAEPEGTDPKKQVAYNALTKLIDKAIEEIQSPATAVRTSLEEVRTATAEAQLTAKTKNGPTLFSTQGLVVASAPEPRQRAKLTGTRAEAAAAVVATDPQAPHPAPLKTEAESKTLPSKPGH